MGKQAKARRRREGWGCTNRRFQPITARDDDYNSEEDDWGEESAGKSSKKRPAGIQRSEKAAKKAKMRRKENKQLRLFMGTKAPKPVIGENQELVPVDWSKITLSEIEKDVWMRHNGKVSETVDDALKQQRKSIGLSVRGAAAPAPVENASDTKLPKPIRLFLADAGFATLTPVQRQVIPAVLSGKDVVATAPTGSGKTLSYMLPSVPHILRQDQLKVGQGPIVLVLLPTRELAAQVERVCVKMFKLFGLRCVALHGGVNKEEQVERLLSPTHIVAGTPGRIIDLVKGGQLTLARVTYFVLDEADRMLALGFVEQLDAIKGQIRPDRQVVLTSATCPEPVQQIILTWIKEPVVVRVKVSSAAAAEAINAAEGAETEVVGADTKVRKALSGVASQELVAASNIEQIIHVCAEHKKMKKLMKFIATVKEEDKSNGGRVQSSILIFCNKIKKVGVVAEFLKRQKLRAAALHGQLPQTQRESELEQFRAGRTQMLVATDVAGRGIDIANLKYVVNYDFPGNLEQYIHRIGRAGRTAGTAGHAYSFFTRNLATLAPGLLKYLERSKQKIDPYLKQLAADFVDGKLGNDEDEKGAKE